MPEAIEIFQECDYLEQGVAGVGSSRRNPCNSDSSVFGRCHGLALEGVMGWLAARDEWIGDAMRERTGVAVTCRQQGVGGFDAKVKLIYV